MQKAFDVVIRGGTIADGQGGELFEGDLAIIGDRVAAIGRFPGSGVEEIDARGRLVTPGFVDVHTHYDAQVTWDDFTEPSSQHGVTTVLTGNCGVGFAPCRPEDREQLVQLMEGVEDIPEIVMAAGLSWNWETFSDFLNVVDRPRDIDVAMYVPHSALRVYAMGQRGIDRERATQTDMDLMARLAQEAMGAGAIGFSTSRGFLHRDSKGNHIPSWDTSIDELRALAVAVGDFGRGAIEALVDFDDIEADFGLLRMLAETSGRPVSFTLMQNLDHPDTWREILPMLESAKRDGLNMRGQVFGRPTGLLLGLNMSLNPFSLYPAYKALSHLPLQQRVDRMRQAGVRAAILESPPPCDASVFRKFLEKFDRMFVLGDPPQYEPDPDASVGAIAKRRGVSAQSIAYDLLLEQEGESILLLAALNYADGNLEPALEMMRDPNTVLGLGDGGAHYGSICDSTYPTSMLTYWARDRIAGDRIPLPEVVKSLSHTPASFIGLADRGVLKRGYKADVNVIDYDNLRLHGPKVHFDLPSGGRRLKQKVDGIDATLVSGRVMSRQGAYTGDLPGRLIRSQQSTVSPIG